jgi:HEAT repeat protein
MDNGERLDGLVRRIASPDPQEAETAAEELSRLSADEVAALVGRLGSERSRATIAALVAVGPRCVPAVLEAIDLRGLDWSHASVLWEIHDHQVDGLFVKELDSLDPRHREIAARAAGEMSIQGSIPQLRRLLADSDQAVAAEAARSLGLLDDAPSAERIADVADRGDDETRAFVAGSLARLDHPSARRKLALLIDDPSPLVREAVITGIARRGLADMVPAIIDRASRADTLELDSILRALTELADRRAVPLLHSMEGRHERSDPRSATLGELAQAALLAIDTQRRNSGVSDG